MKPIRVLVVDDSSFIRRTLAAIIRSDPEMTVAGLASNGRQAVEMADELKPDVITMDINMPEMNGLEALEKIMRASPTAVLMVSQVTEEGAQATMEALSKGAVDFVTKSEGDSAIGLIRLKKQLLAKIKEIVKAPPASPASHDKPLKKKKKPPPQKPVHKVEMVGIGASTGGPKALMKLMSSLPGVFPASGAIVQHMPTTFMKTFVERLNGISEVNVKLAEDGESISPATFLVAPGHIHMKFKATAKGKVYVRLDTEPADSLHRPSVDQMFLSLADAYPGRALGIVMTGMGQDGLIGATAMKEKGCIIIAQDEESSTIYGMPRAVVDNGVATATLPLSALSDYIVQSIKR